MPPPATSPGISHLSRRSPLPPPATSAAAPPAPPDDLPTQPVTQPSPHWPPPYGEAPGQRAQQQPGYGAPSAPGYLFPQGAAEGDGGAGFAAQAAQHQSGAHAPPFNRFPPAGDGAANFGYPPQGTDAPPYGFPHASAQPQAPGGPPWGQQGDARGFDLGNYMSASGQGYGADGGQFDPPPFALLDGLMTLVALLTTAVVLIAQNRQTALEKQRAHLDLQVNLLTEQKVTKLIHLLEELRRDLPMVENRHDAQAAAMQERADAAQVASAIEQVGLAGDSPPP